MRQERKVVSALFCDLVGLTARAIGAGDLYGAADILDAIGEGEALLAVAS